MFQCTILVEYMQRILKWHLLIGSLILKSWYGILEGFKIKEVYGVVDGIQKV